MKFMLTFDWSAETEARAEGIARFEDTGLRPVDGERGEERDVEGLCAITSKSDSYLHFGSAGGKASNLRVDTTLCSARKLDLAGGGEVFNRLRVKWNNGTTAPGRAVDP